MFVIARAISVLILLAAMPLAAAASGGDEADKTTLANGKKLVAESKCEACHIRKAGGDGSSIYTRAERRVTTRSKLLAQVGRCNNELNLGLFPDDEAAIAAYLNATHYKLKE
jgi:mono/diheme cytochrome c family protein